MPEPLGEWSSVAASPDSVTLELFVGVLAGLVTAVLIRAIASLMRVGRARRKRLAGDWYQTSPDPRGVQEVLRVDRVRLYTFASRIWGRVDRQAPAEEQPKRWRFRGRVSGAFLFGYFWTPDIQSNPRSNGTFHLQMVDPFLWVGRYTTAVGAVDAVNPLTVTQELKDLPLEWNREPPDRQRPDSEDGQLPP